MGKWLCGLRRNNFIAQLGAEKFLSMSGFPCLYVSPQILGFNVNLRNFVRVNTITLKTPKFSSSCSLAAWLSLWGCLSWLSLCLLLGVVFFNSGLRWTYLSPQIWCLMNGRPWSGPALRYASPTEKAKSWHESFSGNGGRLAGKGAGNWGSWLWFVRLQISSAMTKPKPDLGETQTFIPTLSSKQPPQKIKKPRCGDQSRSPEACSMCLGRADSGDPVSWLSVLWHFYCIVTLASVFPWGKTRPSKIWLLSFSKVTEAVSAMSCPFWKELPGNSTLV